MLALIPTIADFVNIYKEFCIYFKDDPNVIFSMQNEPHDIDWATFWSVLNQVMVNARTNGADQLWVQQGDLNSMNPIEPAITETNIALETHLYPYYSFAYGVFTWDNSYTAIEGRIKGIYSDKYPVIVGELGANIDNNTGDLETTTLRNILTFFDKKGISWVAHWLRPVGQFRFTNPDATLNESGVIYREFLNKTTEESHECAIFEATTGTALVPMLQPLRLFRDRALSGGLIKLYYDTSKYVAPMIRHMRGKVGYKRHG